MDKNQEERFLSEICRKKTLIWVYLMDGTRLEGYIESFDDAAIYISNSVERRIAKDSICAVIPVQREEDVPPKDIKE